MMCDPPRARIAGRQELATHMTRQEMKAFEAALKDFREKHSSTPEQAREILRKEGVLDRHGKLAKPYARASEKTVREAS